MQYWRLRVNPGLKLASYNIFYKTPINLSKANVPREAVVDGDLLDVFLPDIDQIEEITKEVYYEYMND